MSSSPDQVNLLVRAFKAAWEQYFQPARSTAVLECLARPALARFLVEKTRQGIVDEPRLAAAGLEFLRSFEYAPAQIGQPDLSWTVQLEKANARFAPVGRVRWLADAA